MDAVMPELQLPTDEDRRLLRDSVRNFLLTHWPEQGAVVRSEDPHEIKAGLAELAAQGLTELGSDPSQGGLREILIVQQELGRAACPAPVLAASIANLLLDTRGLDNPVASTLLNDLRTGKAAAAIAFGPLDGDRTACTYELKSGKISGEARYLDVAHCATHFILVTSRTSIAIVEAQ